MKILVSPDPDINSCRLVLLHDVDVDVAVDVAVDSVALCAAVKAAHDSRTLVDVVPTVRILFLLDNLL